MVGDSILLDRKTGKPVIATTSFEWNKDRYPKHKSFICDSYTFHPHPYMITPYHLENNPHHMYIGDEQIEQMESDINHSLCGWGRTGSGKREKKGQTACTLLIKEHERIMVIKIDGSYIKSTDGQGDKNKLRNYVKSINELVTEDGFVGYVFMEDEDC